MYLGNGSLALKELNERNTIFWRMQSELTLKQLSNETIFNLAKNDMDSEVTRGVPLRSRKTFGQALVPQIHQTVFRGLVILYLG